MKAQEAVRHAPVELPVDATIGEAARLMDDRAVGAVVVVDQEGGRPVGIVTDRDLVIQVVARGLDPKSVKVADVYTEKPVVATPEEPLDQALQRMAEEQVRRLPVVSDGELVGMLAQADVARSADAQSTGHMVEEISKK